MRRDPRYLTLAFSADRTALCLGNRQSTERIEPLQACLPAVDGDLVLVGVRQGVTCLDEARYSHGRDLSRRRKGWPVGRTICSRWGSRVLQVALCALAAASVALSFVGAPQAFAGSPFAGVSGTCSHYDYFGTSFQAAPVFVAHPNVLVRLALTDDWSFVAGTGSAGKGGDLIWKQAPAVSIGGQPTYFMDCHLDNSDVRATVDFFDAVPPPVSLDGIGPGTPGFVAQARGPYAADIALSEGSVTVNPDASNQQVFSSSGTYYFHVSTAALDTLPVRANDGPRPRWTVTFRALPVSVSNLSLGASTWLRPGVTSTANYTLDGDTRITGQVLNSAGAVVRTLASGYAAQEGDRGLTWDGRDSAGGALPDGTYVVRVQSNDYNGQSTAADASIQIDGTPPTMARTSPERIAPEDVVLLNVADAGSGVKSAYFKVDGRYATGVEDPTSPSVTLKGPWKAGSHTVTASLADAVGNTTEVEQSFTVAAALGCNRTAARSAILRSRFRRTLHRLGLSRNYRAGDIEGFGVTTLICADLTGDGKPEMAALLTCCTAGSPTPLAIFDRTGTGWRFRYGMTRHPIWGLSRSGRSLILRQPVWRRGDGNCCPSSYRHYRLAYRAGGFKLRRAG